jgi:hypothetical protein
MTEDEWRAFAENYPDSLAAALYRLHVAARGAKREATEGFKDTRLYRWLAWWFGR